MGGDSISGLSGLNTPSRREDNGLQSRDSVQAEMGMERAREDESEEKGEDSEEFSDDIDKLHGQGGLKESLNSRSSRGLRVLSVRVRELVFEKRKTTYKEVADELIRELVEQGKMPRDARNVGEMYMISAG